MVRPGKVDAVKAALCKLRVCAVTVAEVHDYAPQAHGTTVGHEYKLLVRRVLGPRLAGRPARPPGPRSGRQAVTKRA
jgi:hypothetical protein